MRNLVAGPVLTECPQKGYVLAKCARQVNTGHICLSTSIDPRPLKMLPWPPEFGGK